MVARKRKKVSFKNNKRVGRYVDITFEIAAELELGREAHVFDASVHYIEKGEGKPLILVHGMGQSLYTWRQSIDFFAQNGYHVYAIDLPGFGYSTRPNIYYTAEENAIMIKAFMDALKIKSADFAGFSTGALSVLALSQMYPKKAKRIVLVSPGGPNETYPFSLRFLTARLGQFLFRSSFSEFAIEKLLKDLYFDKTLVTTQVTEQYFLPFESKRVRDTLIMYMEHFEDTFSYSDFNRINSEILVFSGSNDPIHSLDIAEKFEAIAGSKHIRIRNCGHFVNEEKPERFNSETLKFLKHKKTENYFY